MRVFVQPVGRQRGLERRGFTGCCRGNGSWFGGRGKSGGVRTLLAYRIEDKAFFVYGFAKNMQANINDQELKGLKRLAAELLGYSNTKLNEAVESGALIEVVNDE